MDTSRISILLQISDASRDDLDYCFQTASEALEISKRLKFTTYQAKSYQAIGKFFNRKRQFDSSLYYFKKAESLYDTLEVSKDRSILKFQIGIVFEQVHDIDSASFYYRIAVKMAKESAYEKGIADFSYFLGNIENVRGNTTEALTQLEIAHTIYLKEEFRELSWRTFNAKGVIYDNLGMYPEALENYLKANEIANEFENLDAQISLSNNLGLIYQELDDKKKAADYLNRAYHLASEFGLVEQESFLLNNLSILEIEKGDTLAAWSFLKRAHQINLETERFCDIAYSGEGLGEIMMWRAQNDSAMYYYKLGIKWAKECNNFGSLASIYRNLGMLFIQLGNDNEAEKYLLKSLALSETATHISIETETAHELFLFYQRLGKYSKALKYHIEYTKLKDQTINEEAVSKIERMNAEYDFKQQMKDLQFEKKAREMQLVEEQKSQKTYQTSILIVLILTILLAATLGRSFYLMQQHNKKLKGLNEEKNTLIGVVAHDLRSPLNNIKGLMSLVKMESSNLSAEQMHYFNLVDDTMERMRDMIDRVLDVSAIEDMKVHLNLKNVDLGYALNFVAGNYENLAAKKTIKIHCDVPVEKHYSIVDYNYLIQVFDNLLSNAIKFSETEKNIFIDIFNEDEYEIVVFRDEGPGINEDDMKKLFSKFQKLSAKPTSNEQSTGLGLSIVKKFVDAMNAQIGCESEVGKGTSFIIKFKTAELIEAETLVEKEA